MRLARAALFAAGALALACTDHAATEPRIDKRAGKVTLPSAALAATVDNAIFRDDFESGDLSVWQDGVNPAKHQIVNDASLAHSGTHSLQMTYPAGQSGGWLTRFFMPGYDSVYVSYWVRLDPTWSGGTALLSIRGSRIDDQWSAFGKSGVCPAGTDFFSTSILAGAPSNPLDLSFSTYYVGMAPAGTTTCSGQTQGAATTYGPLRRLTTGVWHQIELWVKLNTVGQSDGVERMWLDGQLAGTWTALTLRTDAVLALNSLMLDGAATAPQTQHLYIDDVQVLPAMPATPPPPPAPVAAVAVTLNASSLTAGQSTQAVARLTDAAGNVLTNRAIVWSSSSTATATVDSTGLVTAVAAGSATITATSEGMTGTAPLTVTVQAQPVASIGVTLNAPSLTLGQSTQAVAVLRDANGNTITGGAVTWKSGNASVAVVDENGLVTAVGPGIANIVASDGWVYGFATLTVAKAAVPVATVLVTLSPSSLTVGQTEQATTVLKDASGNVLTGRTISWASSNAIVATVNSTGLVTAVGAGSSTITATSEGITGTAPLTVTAPTQPVASISVTLNAPSLTIGQSTQAVAVLRDANGNTITGGAVTWKSGNASVAVVDENGLVTAVGPGIANIVANVGWDYSFATLTVTTVTVPVATVAVTLSPSSLIVGQTVQAAAVLKDGLGNVLPGRTITWSSSNTAAATVSSTGLVTAVAAGTANIVASSEGITGQSTVTVTATAPPPVPVASVTVTLNSPSLTTGQSTQATAITKDAGGNVLTGRVITWSSSNTAVATVSSAGLVQAVGAGTASIRATSETITGSANLTVTSPAPAPVATVTLSPSSANLTVGATQQFSATLKDASGITLTGRVVTWSSSAPGVASVTATGLVTALATGSATISATSETKIGTAGVSIATVVSPGPGVPVYDPSNSDHVLHVFEDWSTYATAADIGRVNRVDGGGPWTNDSPSFKSFSTNNNDPWFGKKTLDIDYQQGPASGQSEGHGLNLEQNTPERYLNTSQAKASLVIEWAWRFSGTRAYVGKFADWQPFAGTDRFNYQLSYDPMGVQGSSCNSDPLCSKYYANNGTTALLPGLMPTARTEGMQFARSINLNTWFYTQNRNYGTGAGKVSWGGQGETMLDNQWRRTILRLTLNQNGVMGQGRLEEWLQVAGQPAVKVMEYIGDVGGFDQGLINSRNGSAWFTDSSILHFYNLSAVAGIFDGGSTVHVGYFRMWSESRP